MKTTIFLSAFVAALFSSCGNDSTGITPEKVFNAMADKKDSIQTPVLTTLDSMDLIFTELEEDYQEFLKGNEGFDLETHETQHFIYEDSFGVKVNLVVSDVMHWGSIFHGADGYSIGKDGGLFIVRTHPFQEETGEEEIGDSLVVQTPNELQMALLPFHTHMNEAKIAVAKLKMERKKKLELMMKKTS